MTRRALIAVLLLALVAPGVYARLPRGSSGTSSGTTLTLASYVNSGVAGGAVQITLGYTGTPPSGAPATWSGGGGTSSISGFAISAPFVTFYASTPATAGTYTLSGPGWATGNIVVTAAVADFANGIRGPPNVSYGFQAFSFKPLGTYLARGLIGPQTAFLTGIDAGSFQIQPASAGTPGFQLSAIVGQQASPSVWNIIVNITDGLTTYSQAVTVQNPASGVPVDTLDSNFVLDSETTLNFVGKITVGTVHFWDTTGFTFSDPSGLFTVDAFDASDSLISVTPAELIPANFGVHNVTITPIGGSAFTVPLYIGHEAAPTITWQPNGGIWSSTPVTNGYGSNRLGTILAYSDSGTKSYAYTSNPSGALQTYQVDPFYGRSGFTYLTSQVAAGTLAGTNQATSNTALTSSIVFSLPVKAGTTLSPSAVSVSLVSGLTNFLPTAATPASGGPPVGTPTTVATLTASGIVPDWSKTVLDMPNSTAQLTRGIVFFGDVYYPRYALGTTTSGTAQVTAWNLSAVDETTPQVDSVVATLTDGNGTFVSVPFSVSSSWIPCTAGALSVGPIGSGATWTDTNTMGAAITAAPATYAGCTIKVLHGVDNHWQWSYLGGSSYSGWLNMPLHFKGDDSTQASFTGTISGTTLTVSGVTGTIAATQWIATGAGTGVIVTGGSGTTWTVNKPVTIGPVAMTTQWQQIAVDFTGVHPAGNSQGCFAAGGGYDVIWERMEAFNCSNGNNAGAFYTFNQQSGNVTLRNDYAHNSDMGYEGGDGGRRVYLIGNLFAANGNGPAGSSHNIYIDPLETAVVTGNYSVDSLGHEFKSRAMNATITGNYFLEGINWYGWASPFQNADGGLWAVSNNVVLHGANDDFSHNGAAIETVNEPYAHPVWANSVFTANDNTILNTVVPGLGPPYDPAAGFLQVDANADPIRGTPFVNNITNTQFWNLDSSRWSTSKGAASPSTLGAGNAAIAAFPFAGIALINPLTGAAPTNLPHRAGYVGQIASVPGVYDMVMTLPTASAANTNVAGGLLAGYDANGVLMTGPSASVSSGWTETIVGNATQLAVSTSGLADGIYYPQVTLTATGGGTAPPLPAATYFPVIVGAGGIVPADGFGPGIHVSASMIISPDTTTATRVMSGFTRGTGCTYSVADTGGGSPWFTVGIDSTTTATSNFTLYPTAAGLALSTGSFTYSITLTATCSSTYTQTISFWVLPGGSNIAVAGGNILPATQAAVGGVWGVNNSATLHLYADPTNTSSGDTPIPDTRFSTSARFFNTTNHFGDPGSDGLLGENASVAASFSSSNPLTLAGFFRVENSGTNVGAFTSYGDQTDYEWGNLVLSTVFADIQIFNRINAGAFNVLSDGVSFWNGATSQYVTNQWQFIENTWASGVAPVITTDGVTLTPGTSCTPMPCVVQWPTVHGGDFLGLTFGSYLFGDPGVGADIHNFSGGLREWVAVVGTPPTPAELENYRTNAPSVTPMSIWGARVWGWWHFTSDPQAAGHLEPDASGNGHDLTYANLSSAPGATLPVRETQGVPYLVDVSGHFQLVSLGGGNYQFQTTPSVTSLAAIYGMWPVVMVVNGFQFPTTIFVPDGS